MLHRSYDYKARRRARLSDGVPSDTVVIRVDNHPLFISERVCEPLVSVVPEPSLPNKPWSNLEDIKLLYPTHGREDRMCITLSRHDTGAEDHDLSEEPCLTSKDGSARDLAIDDHVALDPVELGKIRKPSDVSKEIPELIPSFLMRPFVEATSFIARSIVGDGEHLVDSGSGGTNQDGVSSGGMESIPEVIEVG
jgi:hypothetical protein